MIFETENSHLLEYVPVYTYVYLYFKLNVHTWAANFSSCFIAHSRLRCTTNKLSLSKYICKYIYFFKSRCSNLGREFLQLFRRPLSLALNDHQVIAKLHHIGNRNPQCVEGRRILVVEELQSSFDGVLQHYLERSREGEERTTRNGKRRCWHK